MSARATTVIVFVSFLIIAAPARANDDETKPSDQSAVEDKGFLRNGSASSDRAMVGNGSASSDRAMVGNGPPGDGGANGNRCWQSGSGLPFKYVGNSFSSKFHRPSCMFAKCISSYHAVFFAQRHNAIEGGYTPCRWCLPPNWKTVHLIIVPPKVPSSRHESAP
jgi:hypothetical protein